ncbi:MAG: glycosyltransferase family 2 protein [Proteobacteria bacterium]|nr:glycosyltransferase family 2 protein [Pseudomonadota bacterium]
MNHKSINRTITVIVPTLNGADTLREFFAALKRQHLQPDEILVGDSSSLDQTVAICQEAGAKVTLLDRDTFDHGGTRTKLAKQARGEILVFFTQDAILATRDALERLIAPLLLGDQVACTYGRQLPGKNASPVAAHLRLFNYPQESSVRKYADRCQYGLKTIFISNSFAAYKKDCLNEFDYFKNGLIFGEDTCTLGRILAAGHEVVYVADAAVYHSHNYSLGQELRRSFDIGVLHSSEKWLLDTYGGAETVGVKYIQSVLSMLLREKRYLLIPDCLLRIVFKMIGYKLGRSYKKLPASWRPLLSMHRLWWQRHT